MNQRLKFITLLFYCFAICSCAQSITEITPKTYVVHKTLDNIKIDGDESDISWSKVDWSDSFIDIEGVKNPTYQTQVKMLWDDTYFYVLAKLEEPHVWANLKQRDTIIFYNNDFEVFIDPDGDTHNYYELEINALNTAWDLFVSKPYRELNNVVLNDWDIIGLKSAIKVDGTINNSSDIDKGWVLELAIPWSAFRTSYYNNIIPGDNFWKVNFSRVNWLHTISNGQYVRKKDQKGDFIPEFNWVWSPTGVVNMHLPEKWGYVYFSTKEIGQDEIFTIPQDEKIKWALFTLYRSQNAYRHEHGTWATNIDSLVEKTLVIDNKTLKPKLENHSTGYNILLKSPFSNKTLIIKEDGKIISN
jgi:hypothetical protein